jgi:hypothetical protein
MKLAIYNEKSPSIDIVLLKKRLEENKMEVSLRNRYIWVPFHLVTDGQEEVYLFSMDIK